MSHFSETERTSEGQCGLSQLISPLSLELVSFQDNPPVPSKYIQRVSKHLTSHGSGRNQSFSTFKSKQEAEAGSGQTGELISFAKVGNRTGNHLGGS